MTSVTGGFFDKNPGQYTNSEPCQGLAVCKHSASGKQARHTLTSQESGSENGANDSQHQERMSGEGDSSHAGACYPAVSPAALFASERRCQSRLPG